MTGRRRDVMWRFMTFPGSSRENSPRLTAAETNKLTNPAQSSLRNKFLSIFKFAKSEYNVIRSIDINIVAGKITITSTQL